MEYKMYDYCKWNAVAIDHFRMEIFCSYPKVPDPEPSTTHCWYPLITASHASSIWSLKSLRIRSCDPMCQIRKISSLFGTLGHKQNIITCDYTSASSCKLNRLFWSFHIETLLCVEFLVNAPLKSCF